MTRDESVRLEGTRSVNIFPRSRCLYVYVQRVVLGSGHGLQHRLC